MNTTKIIGFLQGALYPVAAAFISYLIANLGSSGLFNATVTVIITGILKMIEDQITRNTGNALFGMVKTPTSYSI